MRVTGCNVDLLECNARYAKQGRLFCGHALRAPNEYPWPSVGFIRPKEAILQSVQLGCEGLDSGEPDAASITPDPDHETYGRAFEGEHAGGFPFQIPAEALFTKWGKGLTEKTVAGIPPSPTMKQQSLLTKQPVQKADQEWLDTVMPHYERSRKWGYYEGGSISS